MALLTILPPLRLRLRPLLGLGRQRCLVWLATVALGLPLWLLWFLRHDAPLKDSPANMSAVRTTAGSWLISDLAPMFSTTTHPLCCCVLPQTLAGR